MVNLPGRIPHINSLKADGNIRKKIKKIDPDIPDKELAGNRISNFLRKFLANIFFPDQEKDIHAHPKYDQQSNKGSQGSNQVFLSPFQSAGYLLRTLKNVCHQKTPQLRGHMV